MRPRPARCSTSGPDKVVYAQGALQSFVDQEVRPKLSSSASTFSITVSNICGGTQASYLTIGIDPSDFYIVRVDGVTLSNTQSTYTTANVELSEDDLLSAYNSALTFKKLTLTEQQKHRQDPGLLFRRSRALQPD